MNRFPSSRQGVISGAWWIGFGFAGQQAVALLRTLILARLLTPEDFGLAGVVMLTLLAGAVLTEWGVESILIQRVEVPPQAVHTGWTLTILRGCGLFVLLQAVAPWIAAAVDRPDVELLLRVGAISFLLINIPAVPAALLLRDLQFSTRAMLDAGRDVFGTVCAIALAFWLGNVWALIIGLLLGQFAGAVAIWFLYPFRPRWMLDQASLHGYWQSGRHLYASGLMAYVVTKGDDITVGKLRGVAELGQYQVVFGIAETLTRGLGELAGKVVFPAYARMTAEGRGLADAFDRVWRLHLLLLLPIVAVLALFPSSFVRLFLGAQWLPAATPLAVLMIAEALRALAAVCGTLVLAGGKMAYLSRIKLVEVICFSLLIVPMTAAWGMTGAAGCLVVVYILSLAGHIYGAEQIESVIARMAAGSWEPVLLIAVLSGAAWWAGLHAAVPIPVCIAILLGLWGVYLWLRHTRLLIMLTGDAQPKARSNP